MQIQSTRRASRVCLQCAEPFTTPMAYIRKGGGLFCSRPCYHAAKIGAALPIDPRFWKRVTKTDSCWLWSGSQDGRSGYGRISVNGHQESVHRVAYAQASGDVLVPDDIIGHTCDTPSCVRNDDRGTYEIDGTLLPRWGHLFKGTHLHNQHDKVAKGRQARAVHHGRHTKPEAFPHGSQAPNAKLTEAMVREIRAIYAQGGVRQVDLAARYGMKQPAISSMLRRETWKHCD